MERHLKGEDTLKEGYVEMTVTTGLNKVYTVYAGGKERKVTSSLEEAEKTYQKWLS